MNNDKELNEIEKDMIKFFNQFDLCAKLRYEKLKKYGVESYKSFGLNTPIIRINDKINRILNLLKANDFDGEESITDNLRDICNYSLMGLIILSDDFKKLQQKVLNENQEDFLSLQELKNIYEESIK